MLMLLMMFSLTIDAIDIRFPIRVVHSIILMLLLVMIILKMLSWVMIRRMGIV